MTATTTAATRRKFVQGLGVTGAVAIVGCLDDSAPWNDADSAADDGARGETDDDDDDDDDGRPEPNAVDVDRIAADPMDIPPPVGWDEPRTHEFTLETVEVAAEIEPGVTVES